MRQPPKFHFGAGEELMNAKVFIEFIFCVGDPATNGNTIGLDTIRNVRAEFKNSEDFFGIRYFHF